MKIDTIIFISNPFGFGPTSRVLIVMEELANQWNGKIIYAASSKCIETLSTSLDSRIQIIELDERNENQLRNFLLKHPTALVVVSLNRIAIKIAKGLGMPTLFIDSLAWMWKIIPEEYLLADTYYYYDIFGARQKLANIKNAKPIPPILGNLPSPTTNKSNVTVVHIGGFFNPFMSRLSQSYLQILADALLQLDKNKILLIVGGASAIRYIKNKVGHNTNHIHFKTLKRDSFIKNVWQARRLVTTPGFTATLEAFAMETPTAFLLPTNLSQWKQLKLFTASGAAPLKMEWEDYLQPEWNFDALTEKKAIPKFELLSVQLLKNKNLYTKIIADIKVLITSTLDTIGQRKFIHTIGWGGSSAIVSDILKLITSGDN